MYAISERFATVKLNSLVNITVESLPRAFHVSEYHLQTIRFKSYLLSLGIPDPVTRETHGSGNKYFRELAKEISSALEQPLKASAV